MKKDFKPHAVRWNKEKIRKFWDLYAIHSTLQESYFTKEYGDAILNFTKRYIQLEGKILDFGCGAGHLVKRLSCETVDIYGVDFSEETIESARKRLKEDSTICKLECIKDLPTRFEDDMFNVVFLIETIEHLLPEERNKIMKELYRITKKEGYIVITTPNEEDLKAEEVICPECYCVFHRVQHLSSWTAQSLAGLMARFGFTRIVARSITWRNIDGIDHLLSPMREMVRIVKKKKNPHLVYIGKK